MILVTGGSGLVGSHLLFDLVKSGKEVRALKRPSGSLKAVKKIFEHYSSDENLFERIEWVDGDILDVYSINEAMEGVEYVYHCAAIVSFDSRDKKQMLKVNIEGTANVVNVALEKNIRKLCYASSIAALGRKNFGELIDEQTSFSISDKNNNYSISKYLAEQEVWRAAEEGLEVVMVSPGIVIGPGEWGKSSTSMFTIVWNGLKYYSMGGRGFVDVRDVSKAMIKLMDSDISHENFLVVSENLSFRKFFELVSEYLGKPKPNIKATPLMGEIAWRLEAIKSAVTGKPPKLTKEAAKVAHKTYYYSNSKIKEMTGMEFIPVEKSVKDTCEIFLKASP